MPSPTGLADLDARKRALVAACDAQRELLLDEFDHLRDAAETFQRRLKVFSTVASGLALVLPLARTFLRPRAPAPVPAAPPAKPSLLGTVLTGWRVFRQFAPVLQMLLPRR